VASNRDRSGPSGNGFNPRTSRKTQGMQKKSRPVAIMPPKLAICCHSIDDSGINRPSALMRMISETGMNTSARLCRTWKPRCVQRDQKADFAGSGAAAALWKARSRSGGAGTL
jgi:hypothetical protein